jgi:hypothetical protein
MLDRTPNLQTKGGDMTRLGIALVGAAVLGFAAPARASWWVQGVPGATCATDSRTTGSWEYRAQRLLNTDSDPWGIVVPVCPVSLIAPGLQPREYRITLRDAQQREAWCRVYSSNGTLVRQQWIDWSSGNQVIGSLDYPLGWSAGMVEATFHCLLQNGASIDRIEIHWWKP